MSRVRLGELIAPVSGRAGSADLPVYSVTKHRGFVLSSDYFKKQVFSNDLTTYKVVDRGQFAYATIHLDEGSIGVAPERCLVSPMYTVFAIDGIKADADYVIRYLKSPAALSQYPRLGRGTAERRKSISLDALGRLEVPLPPLPEQRRIAAILDEADALHRLATDTLGKLSALRQSLFASAVSEVRTRVSIADVALKVTDGTHQAPGWSVTGVPFLFVSNITSGSIDFSTTKYVSLETYDRLTRHSPIEKGDVLYSTVGSYGVPAVVDSDDPFLFQRHIAHIKPRPDVVDSWYLHAALGSSDFLNQAHRVARGVAQKTVTLGDLSRLTIPLPSIEAQRHVAEQLEAVRRAHGSITHQRSSIRGLFASFQHRAFRGEL